MKTIVVMNPWANRGGAKKQRALLQTLCKDSGIELVFTERIGHAREIAYEAAETGYELVVAAGGDGTVHEVVNGLYEADGAAALGVVPMGSGNDLAFALGIPSRLNEAIDRLRNGKPTPIDLARITDDNGRYRIVDNNIGIGLDAQVVIVSEAIKRIGGFLLYLIATLKTMLYHYIPYRLIADFDDEQFEEDALFVAFGVGPRGGGGFLFNPAANHFDNKIDACIVEMLPRLTALRLMPTTLNGRHIHAKYVTLRQSQTVTIRCDKAMPIHVDGEVFARPEDEVRAVTIQSLPGAIRVML